MVVTTGEDSINRFVSLTPVYESLIQVTVSYTLPADPFIQTLLQRNYQ
jgi:hypothetical protein